MVEIKTYRACSTPGCKKEINELLDEISLLIEEGNCSKVEYKNKTPWVDSISDIRITLSGDYPDEESLNIAFFRAESILASLKNEMREYSHQMLVEMNEWLQKY